LVVKERLNGVSNVLHDAELGILNLIPVAISVEAEKPLPSQSNQEYENVPVSCRNIDYVIRKIGETRLHSKKSSKEEKRDNAFLKRNFKYKRM